MPIGAPSQPGSSTRRWAALPMVVAFVLGWVPAALAATPDDLEACFLEQINTARAGTGAQPLTLSVTLSAYGREHSAEMASAGTLYHSGQAALDPVLPIGWKAWGENVGYATGSESCDWLFQGFWESPSHRDNLLNPTFDTVGIGAIVDTTNTLWTTHVFIDTADSVGATSTTSSAPATTTTAAPTTTSTAVVSTPTATAASPAETTTTGGDDVMERFEAHLYTDPAQEDGTSVESDREAARPPESEPAVGVDATPATLPPEPAPLVASVGGGCVTGCDETTSYILVLIAMSLCGGAISLWAFRG